MKNRLVTAQIKVHVAGDARRADRLPLVNLWRMQAGLSAWSPAQLDKASRIMQVKGRGITLIEFESRPALVTPGAKASLKLTYQVPPGWTGGKKSPFRKASLLVRQGDKQADVSVVVLGVGENWLVNNVNRWRGQLKLKPLDEAAIGKSAKKIAIAGKTGHYIDISGANGKRILAVITQREKELWFFKMMGDAKLVGQQQDAFESFIKSVNLKAAE